MMPATPYGHGFLSKCAEYGADPEVLVKTAYGSGDDTGYIGRVPEPYWSGDSSKIPEHLKSRLEKIRALVGRPLYGDDGPVAGKIHLSRYKYHWNPDTNAEDQISLEDYGKLVEDAIASNDEGKLRDAEDYWSMLVEASEAGEGVDKSAAYKAGFTSKCAEYGVDGSALMKTAGPSLRDRAAASVPGAKGMLDAQKRNAAVRAQAEKANPWTVNTNSRAGENRQARLMRQRTLSSMAPEQRSRFLQDERNAIGNAIRTRMGLASAAAGFGGMGLAGGAAMEGTGEALASKAEGRSMAASLGRGAVAGGASYGLGKGVEAVGRRVIAPAYRWAAPKVKNFVGKIRRNPVSGTTSYANTVGDAVAPVSSGNLHGDLVSDDAAELTRHFWDDVAFPMKKRQGTLVRRPDLSDVTVRQLPEGTPSHIEGRFDHSTPDNIYLRSAVPKVDVSNKSAITQLGRLNHELNHRYTDVYNPLMTHPEPVVSPQNYSLLQEAVEKDFLRPHAITAEYPAVIKELQSRMYARHVPEVRRYPSTDEFITWLDRQPPEKFLNEYGALQSGYTYPTVRPNAPTDAEIKALEDTLRKVDDSYNYGFGDGPRATRKQYFDAIDAVENARRARVDADSTFVFQDADLVKRLVKNLWAVPAAASAGFGRDKGSR